MTSLSRPDNRLYLGRGGSGKTTLALDHARDFPRALMFDPNGLELAARWASDIIESPRELVTLVRLRSPWRVSFRGFARHGIEPCVDLLNRLAWAVGDMVVIWDEVDWLLGPGRLRPDALQLINMGRHRGLRIFATSRRPFRVSRDLSANASRIVAFNMTEPDDVDYLARIMGRAARDTLPRLADFQALDWGEGGAAEKNFYDPKKT